jgi:hypothetical protein
MGIQGWFKETGMSIFRILPLFLFSVSVFAQDPKPLLDYSQDIKSSIKTTAAKYDLGNGQITVHTANYAPWPGITIEAPGGFWDCTGYQTITAKVKNLSGRTITVYMRVDNPSADGIKNCVTESISISPEQTQKIAVHIYPSRWAVNEPMDMVGMRGCPGIPQINPVKINQMIFFLNKPSEFYQFEISDIIAEGEVENLKKETFFPFIDLYGQFIHSEWPGKIHSQDELDAARQAEIKSLENRYAGAFNRDKWGGWTKGPKQTASGYFRVEIIQGHWWLVDPDGNLFWSHGVDCVNDNASTPIADREKYFQWLPKEDQEQWKTCWGLSRWAPVGYYKDKGEYKTFDFARANLMRKYGQDWSSVSAQLAHNRLKNWAMNTIGNWSDPAIYRLQKTPYVTTLGFQSRLIEGSEGYWGKFPDPFDASFRQNCQAALNEDKKEAFNDPWCIGVFVHNELSWGDETSLALAVLGSPADQPAKKEFVNDLTQKYKVIDKLNNAWGISYASWQAVLQSTQLPDKTKSLQDLKEFDARIAEQYFKIIHDQLKAAAPNLLYLGCRFAWASDTAVRASAKYCDVVSFNRYDYSVADLKLPEGINKPVIIGEFHFGALDRGMFHTGLKVTKDQNDRAQKYKEYVFSALRNPYIVGTHWFQYRDQATTGRGDGENYQIGLVDICDTPYPETIDAIRKTGQQMYEYRYTTSQIK